MKLVSAILPTRGRREFARQALESFLDQTYPEKELLILDDIDDPSFPDGVPHGHRILRWLSNSRLIAKKRNDLCGYAAGPIIMHFDSDDWSAPDRMADQVERLEMSGAAVTGYHSILFFDGRVFKYIGSPNYAVGTSLAFTKEWWAKFPFPENVQDGIGEDNEFVCNAYNRGRLCSVDGGSMIVARVHVDNTSKKDVDGFKFVGAADSLPKGFPS